MLKKIMSKKKNRYLCVYVIATNLTDLLKSYHLSAFKAIYFVCNSEENETFIFHIYCML